MFRHPERAQRSLIRLEPCLTPETRATLYSLLRQSPDPDSALHYLDGFLSATGAPPGAGLPSGSRLHALLAVFAHSRFLADTLFQRPDLLGWALDKTELYRVLPAEECRADLGRLPLEQMDRSTVALELARFKRRHLLRIVLRDVLGLATLAEVALELSTLADTLLEAALERLYQELVLRHGHPRVDGRRQCEFAVLALGKLGGRELNYSSDIDLMYLFGGGGETDGPERITNKEFFIKLGNQITELLSANTTEGFCYRVDLRLRPEGRLGEVALSLSGAEDYYRRRARDWELQMLIKARAAAGSQELGRCFLDFVEPLIYKTTTDFSAIESVSEARQRIHEKLHRRVPSGLNVKLSRGGIRDIEFLVQCLQRLYGGRDPWVRQGGTLFAMHRLRDKGYLAARDYARLTGAYQFLRTLEHRLQMEHERQTHTLPQREEALETLAAKMGVWSGSGPWSAEELLEETRRHLREVSAIYDRVIHGHGPSAQSSSEAVSLFQLEMETPEDASEWSEQAQLRYIESKAPELAARLAAASPRRGRRLFQHFLARVIAMPEILAAMEQKPELLGLAADLFECSPFFAEWLIRNPEQIHELLEMAAFGPTGQQAELFELAPDHRPRDNPELEHLIRTQASATEKSAWLRRFYRRQMLRIQTESICRCSPIFSVLDQTTELADCVVRAAYQIALDEVLRSGATVPKGAGGPGYPSRSNAKELYRDPMHVVALGRLGMREFDLGSDADLVFIIPDPARPDLPFWTRVAERMIDVLSSYTGEGVIFSIDTRLRPLGREGELVQTEDHYTKY
ncbi:MAG: glutamine-synthetase adenylyltransferase, partial [Acidobacteria bacterium]|nr:glutamine-synthetase adenylyltransferase [Acidobacteriota bacterium]